MKIGGTEYPPDQLLVIAHPPGRAQHAPGVVTTAAPCRGCQMMLQIDQHSGTILEAGGIVLCVRCALAQYPGLVCGTDPDTGEPVTLAQMVRRPNMHGSFRWDG